jgi:molybdopterin molybdotransferase
VFGLPGNPVSTLVCFGLFVKPALERLYGKTVSDQPRLAALTVDYHQRDARPTYFPSRRAFDGHCDTVTPLPWRGSADLRALADANCLAFFPGGERLYAAGELVPTYSM